MDIWLLFTSQTAVTIVTISRNYNRQSKFLTTARFDLLTGQRRVPAASKSGTRASGARSATTTSASTKPPSSAGTKHIKTFSAGSKRLSDTCLVLISVVLLRPATSSAIHWQFFLINAAMQCPSHWSPQNRCNVNAAKLSH